MGFTFLAIVWQSSNRAVEQWLFITVNTVIAEFLF